MTSLRSRFFNFLNNFFEVFLRIPSLFYMEIMMKAMSTNLLPDDANYQSTSLSANVYKWAKSKLIIVSNGEYNFLSTNNTNNDLSFSSHVVNMLLDNLAFFIFFMMAFMSLKTVIWLHLHLISATLIFLCGAMSRTFVCYASQHILHNIHHDIFTTNITPLSIINNNSMQLNNHMSDTWMHVLAVFTDNRNLLYLLVTDISCQIAVGIFVSYLLSLHFICYPLVILPFLIPVIAFTCGVSIPNFTLLHNSSILLMLNLTFLYMLSKLKMIVTECYSVYSFFSTEYSNHGFLRIPFLIWHHYHLSAQMLFFWIGLFLSAAYWLIISDDVSLQDIESNGQYMLYWWMFLLRCISQCCASPISMLALCVTVTYTSFAILSLVKLYLHGFTVGFQQHDVDMDAGLFHGGLAEGVIMLLVMLKTGISDVQASHRHVVMLIIMIIVLSSLLESLHEIVKPHLLSLAASCNKSVMKHVKAVLLAVILCVVPIHVIIHLMSLFNMGFWLLVVVSSCLLTSLEVFSTLLMYSLFLYDNLRAQPYANLDDVIYYIKAFVHICELLVALIVIAFGTQELILEQWNLLSASILTFHFYFNIWQKSQTAWGSFLQRKTAAQRLSGLVIPAEAELQNLNDVCPICYQDLCEQQGGVVRRTLCNHYFHEACLKKWLFVNDTCPMCHSVIHVGDSRPNFDDNDHNDNTDINRNSHNPCSAISGLRATVSASLNNVTIDSQIMHEYDESDDDDVSFCATLSSSSQEEEIYDDKDIDLSVYGEDNSYDVNRNNNHRKDDSDTTDTDENDIDDDDDDNKLIMNTEY